jgi:hypothetical protein
MEGIMTFLKRRIMASQLSRAQYYLNASRSPFTSEIMREIHAQQATSFIQSCINQLRGNNEIIK